jgi:Pyruvate/2-oxoacid:ferredoxin oxidoreductase gamma subunit
VVLGGAALAFLPIPGDSVEEVIREAFASRGPRIVDGNLAALAAGRALAETVASGE